MQLFMNCPPDQREKMAGYQMACRWFHEMSHGGIENALKDEIAELARRAEEDNG